ncbi:MAG TPA: asparagine synthetase B, partial [Planctomycetota bacterium]|nr:asparagine synthetase B [Planctomycetota bacterium]
MCGFAGIFLIRASVPEPELRARITAMAACIAHRGPDAQNVLLTRHAGVGFRRLAIVDLQTGDQP